MQIFYFTISIVFILSIIGNLYSDKNGKQNIVFAILIATILILVSGMRENMGDTPAYIHLYKLLNNKYDIFNSPYEYGFLLFMIFLKNINSNPQFMIFATSFIINAFNVYIIRKYSKNCFELSIFMYITMYYIVTMNGIRQSLVAAVVFLCTPLLIKRNYKIYFLVIILLYTVHSSVLIMLPIYFICTKEIWSKSTIYIIIIAILGMIAYQPLSNVVFNNMGSKYAAYKDLNEGGANIIRVVVYFVPVLLSYIKKEELKLWKYGNTFGNITLINFIIMTFSYYNWIFARFTIYTQLYVTILLPFIIKNCFYNKKERLVIIYFFIAFYFIFFFYDSRVCGINYISNYNFLNFFYNVLN